MNTDKQRMAIAEARRYVGPFETIMLWHEPTNDMAQEIPVLQASDGREVPDYLNDLNAMHGAFSAFDNLAPLTRHQWWQRYWGHICDVLGVPYQFMPQHDTEAQIKFYRATAAQRAEAFLRTIGKWEEA